MVADSKTTADLARTKVAVACLIFGIRVRLLLLLPRHKVYVPPDQHHSLFDLRTIAQEATQEA